MNKNFVGEYLIVSFANLQIINEIFSIDLLKTLLILFIQLIMTTIVRILFDKVKTKKRKTQ